MKTAKRLCIAVSGIAGPGAGREKNQLELSLLAGVTWPMIRH